MSASIDDLTLDDADSSATILDDEFGATSDRLIFDGSAAALDSSQSYNVTLTYTDGTNASSVIVLVQDTDGRVFLIPFQEGDAIDDALEAKPIASIRLDSIGVDDAAGINHDINSNAFISAEVDGTSGNDVIGASFVDVDGTQVDGTDGTDDTILAGAGSDSVDAGTGEDTLYGGDGDDTLDDRSGADTVYGGAGNDTLVTSNAASAGDDTFYGGDGDDLIDVSNGGDTAFGGDGSDTFISLGSSFSKTVTGGEGGTDQDLLSWSGETDSADALSISFTGDEAGSALIRGQTVTFSQIEALAGTQVADSFDAGNDTAGTSIDGQGGNDTISGGSGDDSFSGDTGNDTISGGAGSDLIYGGDGADSLTTGVGEDTLYGGSGDDNLANSAGNDTLFGGTGNDTITATLGDDHLYGGTGNDLLYGGADDDRLYGGDGNDTLEGGDGTDTLKGDGGDDTLIGGAGADSLNGGTGLDTADYSASDAAIDVNLLTTNFLGGHAQGDIISGLDGIVGSSFGDTITGDNSSGADHHNILSGGGGGDTIYGLGQDDTLSGDAGNDTLYGGDDDDLVYGGTGQDTLYGGTGNDLVYGGDDQDVFFVADGFGTDTIYGGEGGTDSDILDLSALGSGVTVTYTGDEQGTFTDGIDTGTFFGIENVILTEHDDDFDAGNDTVGVSIDGRGGNDTLTGGSGADSIYGGTGNDVIEGGAGVDSIYHGDGADLVYGGAGDDLIDDVDGAATATASTIYGDAGNDSIFGTAAGDTIYGGADNDTLSGEDGADTLSGGTGDDIIYSGLGADNIIIEDGFGSDTVYGGEGDGATDALDLSALGTGVTVTFTGDEQGTFTDGTDTGTFFEVERIIGTAHDDIVDQPGFLGARTIFGEGGNDILDGGQSADLLYGGTGNDDLEGGFAADTLYGGAGDDSFNGGDNNDTVFGGTGTDFVLTGGGDDLIYGGDDDDVIFEGEGQDTVYGGLGSDTVQGPVHGANDVFYGGEDVGDGDIDTIDLQLEGAQSISLTGTESGTIFGGGTFFEVEQFNLSNSDDAFDGTAATGGLSVSGRTGDDSITGGSGADTLDGGDNQDLLYGGAGADVLYGGEDNNILDTDTLYGGDGDDSIYSLDSAGADTTNGDILFGGAGSDTLVGAIAADTLFGGVDADSIDGAAGNDTIDGGAGNDTLTGGTGDDMFLVSAGGGDDTISDFGTGNDQIDASALSDVGNALTNQDGTVTADEVTVTGGGGSDQVLTFPNGETVTVPDGTVDTTTTATTFASLVAMGVPPCFAPGTRIETPDGPRAVEDLRVGDPVLTADRGAQPLRWIGRRLETFTSRHDKHKPIEIKAGAMGHGLPKRNLVVSPQHRMVLSGPRVEELFDCPEVLGIAKALTGRDGVRQMRGKNRVTYFSLLLDRHEIIYAEGCATESFRPGPEVLKGFEPQIREQVYAIYPDLRLEPVKGLGPPARPIVSRSEAVSVFPTQAPRVESISDACDRLEGLQKWDGDLEQEKRMWARVLAG